MKPILCNKKNHWNRAIKPICCLMPILYQHVCIFSPCLCYNLHLPHPICLPGLRPRRSRSSDTRTRNFATLVNPTWKSGRGEQRRTKKISWRWYWRRWWISRGEGATKEKKKTTTTTFGPTTSLSFGTCRRMCGLVGVDVVVWHVQCEKKRGSTHMSLHNV